MLDLELATGQRTRRVHLVPHGEQVAICQGMTAPQRVAQNPFKTMAEQTTCANCRKALERKREEFEESFTLAHRLEGVLL